MVMVYRGVIFDLDGTLLDTLEDIADTMNQVLAGLGHPRKDLGHYRRIVGAGVRELIRLALPEGAADPETVEGCVGTWREEYGRRWDRKTGPYPGIEEMLSGLRRLGTPSAVLSNKNHDFTVALAERFLGGHPFSAVFGLRPEVPKKPDPAGALEIAKILDLHPDTILYVGDTPTDMETALAAGMEPVAVAWGFRPAGELLSAGAKRLLDHPRDLLPLLGVADG
jgi:phosphoglycolate phosphatase